MPEGIRCSLKVWSSTTTVWPALTPPWYRTTTSADLLNRSVIFPFPSSPHWAPITTTLAKAFQGAKVHTVSNYRQPRPIVSTKYFLKPGQTHLKLNFSFQVWRPNGWVQQGLLNLHHHRLFLMFCLSNDLLTRYSHYHNNVAGYFPNSLSFDITAILSAMLWAMNKSIERIFVVKGHLRLGQPHEDYWVRSLMR